MTPQNLARIRKTLVASALALALAGCAVGPDYSRPAVDLPETWRVDYPQAAELSLRLNYLTKLADDIRLQLKRFAA